ncbi:MAG: RimM [Acidobacteria bacterium]|nr:RimM [Acidobacteriota bacterium]
MEPEAQPSYIVIARIARTRGNRGEVLADSYTDFPDRFLLLSRVWAVLADGSREKLTLESSWEHSGRPVLKFAGIDSISAAERLVGAWIEIEAGQAIKLPEGTYFDHDLVGCAVRGVSGAHLGTVKEILRIAGNHQLVVVNEGQEYMIPAAPGICKDVSIEEKQILVDLPEGLMDLNK